MKKFLTTFLSAAGMVLFLAGCGKTSANILYKKSLLCFDTVVTLQFYAGKNGQELMDHCVQLCQDYEKIFSRTNSESQLYQINHRTSNTVKVSDEIAELVAVGLEYYDLSDGMFDITIAPLSDLWDFKSESPQIPDASDIEAALSAVDASSITQDGNIITFSDTDTMIDLGALAKGYIADHLKTYLTQNGVTSGNLNLGGNVLTIGSRPDGSPWRIGIQEPFSSQGTLADVVEVTDKTVVSSGIYERYFEKGGEIYHHILDPKTGYPVDTDIWGVTVICDSSLTGDALSTTCLLMGYEKAKAFINSLKDVEAIFILENKEIEKTF